MNFTMCALTLSKLGFKIILSYKNFEKIKVTYAKNLFSFFFLNWHDNKVTIGNSWK